MVSAILEQAKKSGRPDLRAIRQQIMDAYPAPVSEQIRKLFAGSTIDLARLRNLVIAYEATTKLFNGSASCEWICTT